jgi:hypothetical protein
MAQLLRLVIVTAFLAIAASEFLPFPGTIKSFKTTGSSNAG